MFCPFCESNEAATPPEVFAIRNPGSSPNGPGWSVRVVPNSRPQLRIEGQLKRRAEALHDLMNGVGAHEIIAETSRHDRSLHELEIEEISLTSSEPTELASSTWRGILLFRCREAGFGLALVLAKLHSG